MRSHPARDAWILAANYSSGVPQIEVASRKGCVDFSNIPDPESIINIVASRKGCVDLSIKYDFINFEFDSRIPQGMRGFELFVVAICAFV